MKVRAPHSIKVGAAKYILYKKTYSRIHRAIKSGFYIEAVALIETLICDRLESYLESISSSPVNISTIGKLLQKLEKLNPLSPGLVEELRAWNKLRGNVIHQFVKVLDEEEISWNKRLSFAREVAENGMKVLAKLRKEIG